MIDSRILKIFIMGAFVTGGLYAVTSEAKDISSNGTLYEAGYSQTDKSKSGNIVTRKSVPEVELSPRLAEAERAVDYLIEEHNRRVDMLEKRAEYQNNIRKAQRIKESYTQLYNMAYSCNQQMIGALFPSNGGQKWEKEIVPQILGNYKNLAASYKADPENAKWWGIYRETTSLDRVKALYNPTTDQIPNDMPQIPKTSKEWDKRYPEQPGTDYKYRMREYNKERWKIGYQLLMDIYHNHSFGVPPLNTRNTWKDQQTRYQIELYSPHYAYIKSHYIKCNIPADPVSGGYTDNKRKNDYYSHLPPGQNVSADTYSKLLGGDFYQAHNEYGKELDRIDVESHEYDVCCNHTCGEDGETCCHSYRSYCCTSGIHTSCSDSPCIGTHPQPPLPPKPLIWNGIRGHSSVAEAIYMDAPVVGGEYAGYYELDSVSGGKNPLKENTLQYYTAIPQPWKEPYNPTGSPTYIGQIYQKGNFTTVDLTKAGGELADVSAYQYFPMHQNRIHLFMDIYDDLNRANDNYTKIVDYENPKLNKKFNDGLSTVRKRTLEDKFYTVDEKEPPVWKSSDVSLGDDAGLRRLNQDITQRQAFYYTQARNIADEVSEAIIEAAKKEGGGNSASINIPSSEKQEESLLYRLGKVYETLYYFGGKNWGSRSLNSTETDFYKIEESCNKLEHLKSSDYRFEKLEHTRGLSLSDVMKGSAAQKVDMERTERLKEADNLCNLRKKIISEEEMKAAATLNSFDSGTCLLKLRQDILQGGN